MTRRTYSVIVGNIGTVHTGHNRREAQAIFRSYVKASKRKGIGRASGEDVVLADDETGEPIAERIGHNNREE